MKRRITVCRIESFLSSIFIDKIGHQKYLTLQFQSGFYAIFLNFSGINIFLDGFVPTENLRFRDESLVFKVSESATEEEVKRMNHYEYPSMEKTMGDFKLTVHRGQFTDSEILVLLGENGTGKTTFIRMLAGNLPADAGSG